MIAPRRRDGAGDLRRAQLRITLATLACLLAVLAVTAVVVLRVHEHALVGAVDRRIASDAERAQTFVDQRTVVWPLTIPADVRVQLLGPDGQVALASDSLRGEPPLWQPGRDLGPQTVTSAGQGDLRVRPSPFLNGWVVFAEPLASAHDAVATLRSILLGIAVPLTGLLAVVVWFAVGRALRPVREALRREEQLVADVSHELRSPLAGMRVLLETEPANPVAVALTRGQSLDLVDRLERLTDRLLTLRRHERAADRPDPHPVDLDELVEVHLRLLASGVGAGVAVDARAVGPGQVLGDPTALASVVENLLTNAVRHARTRVAVAVTERHGTVEVTVDDDGPGIAPAQRATVFERFRRLDEGRARGAGGAGLGLAIVRAVVDAHHGTVAVEDSPLGGARFVVRLPASTPESPEPRRPDRSDAPAMTS